MPHSRAHTPLPSRLRISFRRCLTGLSALALLLTGTAVVPAPTANAAAVAFDAPYPAGMYVDITDTPAGHRRRSQYRSSAEAWDFVGNRGGHPPVVTPFDGTVWYRGMSNNARGEHIIIRRDAAGDCWLFQHLQAGSTAHLQVGQAVRRADHVGRQGNTGGNYAIHLHFSRHGCRNQGNAEPGAPLPSTPSFGDGSISNTRPSQAPGVPIGSLDLVASPGPGQLRVAGWTFDQSHPRERIAVHVYVGHPPGAIAQFNIGPTDGQRPDVANAHPHAGEGHGFDRVLTNLPAGTHRVYAYGIDISPGGNQLIGQGSVTIGSGLSAAASSRHFADFNGDGRADFASLNHGIAGRPSGSEVMVALSTGAGFAAPTRWLTLEGWDWNGMKPITGDFNGDGKTDFASLNHGIAGQPGGSEVMVAWSTGNGFSPPTRWLTLEGWDWNGMKPITGDFNGDGKTDFASLNNGIAGQPDGSEVMVAWSDGSRFLPPTRWLELRGWGWGGMKPLG